MKRLENMKEAIRPMNPGTLGDYLSYKYWFRQQKTDRQAHIFFLTQGIMKRLENMKVVIRRMNSKID